MSVTIKKPVTKIEVLGGTAAAELGFDVDPIAQVEWEIAALPRWRWFARWMLSRELHTYTGRL